MPDRLLDHYTPTDGLLGLLREKRLRATNVLFLNDTQEFVVDLQFATRRDRMSGAT
jgi:hypothetical protein